MNSFEKELDADPFSAQVGEALLMRSSEPEEAIAALEHLAREGSPVAAHALADIFGFGHFGVEADRDRAIAYFEMAKSMGSVEAAYRLGRFFQHIGEYEKALFELDLLSERGLSQASFLLGDLHHKGEISPKDEEKALFYFARADEQGHLLGRQWVGHLMRKKGGIKNWLRGQCIIFSTILPIMRIAKRGPESDALRTW
jgi:TPR repeat protein